MPTILCGSGENGSALQHARNRRFTTVCEGSAFRIGNHLRHSSSLLKPVTIELQRPAILSHVSDDLLGSAVWNVGMDF